MAATIALLALVYAGAAHAQTVTGDSVAGTGTYLSNQATATIDASSGPEGENATGTFSSVFVSASSTYTTSIQGTVTCLNVEDNIATATGPITGGTYYPEYSYFAVTIEDNGLTGDRISYIYLFDTDAESYCNSHIERSFVLDSGNYVVVDSDPVVDECPNIAGAQATVPPGMVKDANGTCVIPPPTTVTVTPVAKTNTVGEEHCVTATAENVLGDPVSGYEVHFTVTGTTAVRDKSSGTVTTNSDGEARFCYTAQFPGQDTITAVVDADDDGTPEATEPKGTATKTYVLPVSTPLCQVSISDGGWIIASNGDRATFGGTAKVTKDSKVQGEQAYQDHGPAATFTVKSTQVLAMTCSGTTATIYGTATIDNVGQFFFRIRVDDRGKSGKGDVYGILLSNGYTSGDQPLRGGNITVLRK